MITLGCPEHGFWLGTGLSFSGGDPALCFTVNPIGISVASQFATDPLVRPTAARPGPGPMDDVRPDLGTGQFGLGHGHETKVHAYSCVKGR